MASAVFAAYQAWIKTCFVQSHDGTIWVRHLPDLVALQV